MSIFGDPRFDALRNALYHTERKTFLDFLNRSLSCIVIVLGAGAAAKAAHTVHIEDSWLEISVVIFATLQLVFDFGSRARLHEFLQKRYYELLSEMADANFDDKDVLQKWNQKLLAISADEPMPMRALDALAYNKAISSIYLDDDFVRANRIYVSWFQRRLRHMFAFHSAEFPTEGTYRASRSNPVRSGIRIFLHRARR